MNLIYGNPSYSAVEGIQQSIMLRELISKGALTSVLGLTPPNLERSGAEIVELIDMGKHIGPDRMAYIEECEWNLYGVYSSFLQSYGIDVPVEIIEKELEVFDPIENYLKIKYNRPRPFQVAGVLGLPLFPRLKTDASSAAYPSGHTLTSMWFRHLYMKRYPHLKDDLMDLALDVKKTREEGGVHYPSDGAFAILVYHRLKDYIV